MRLPDPLQLPFSTLHQTRPGFTSIGRSWQLDISLDDARPLRFFGLIALYDGPAENASINDELALRITDTIRYHKQLLEGSRVSVTVEDFFEQCLQKINAELNIFLRNYAKPLPVHAWAMLIGMLSLDDNPKRLQLSISRFGEIGGWLLHSAQLDTKKLISIFDSPDSLQQQAAPHKFFRNVLTSSLSKNDQLFFCTPNILNYISLSDLKKILSMLSVNAALKQLENQLNFSGHDSVVCAMTMRLSPYPVLNTTETRTVPSGSAQQSIDTLMSTESETQKLLSTTFGLNAKRFFTYGFNRVSDFIGKTVPGAKTVAKPISQSVAKLWRSIMPKRAETSPKRMSIKKPASPLRKMDLLSTNQMVTKVPVWEERVQGVAVPLRNIAKLLRQSFSGFIASGLWKQPRFYVSSLIVVTGLTGLIYWRVTVSRHNTLVAQTQTSLADIKHNVDRIDAFLIVGRENDAASLLQETRAQLASTQDVEDVRGQRQQLENAMTDQARRLRKEIVTEPSVLLPTLADQLGSQAQEITRVKDNFVIFGANPRAFLTYSPQSQSSKTQNIQSDLTAWNAVAAADDNTVLFISDNKVVTLDLKTGNTTSATANTTAPLQSGAVYNDRLYTISPSQQQILRSNRTPSFSVLNNWLKEPVDLSKARSLIVDGSLFVLLPDKILTLNQGKLVLTGGIQLDAIDPPLQDAKAFNLTSDSKYIYILEPKRLVVYQKTGKLKAQYPVKGDQTYVSMMVDETAKKAYLVTATQLMSLNLDI